MSSKGKSVEIESRFLVAQGWVGRDMGKGVTPNRCGGFLEADDNEYTKNH